MTGPFLCQAISSNMVSHNWGKQALSSRMVYCTLWRQQMETFFRVTGPLCGEFTGHRWIPLTKTSDAERLCFFDQRPNKRLNKQSWSWWLETPSRPSRRHCNDLHVYTHGWPSTQPGTCTQPCPIVHTAVPPLFTQPCPGRTMSTAVCIYVAGLCASCPTV